MHKTSQTGEGGEKDSRTKPWPPLGQITAEKADVAKANATTVASLVIGRENVDRPRKKTALVAKQANRDSQDRRPRVHKANPRTSQSGLQMQS